MPYSVIDNFKGGLDRRRPIYCGVPGTCWQLENAHISRGGDIEGRKSFVPQYRLPAGTFGLGDIAGTLYVFGSQVSPAMPLGVTYLRLDRGDGSNMTSVLDAGTDSYNGKMYVIATYDNGKTTHWYDGLIVTDWDTIEISVATNPDILDAIVSGAAKDATATVTRASNQLFVTGKDLAATFDVTTAISSFGVGTDAAWTLASKQDPRAAVAGVDAVFQIVCVRRYASNPSYNISQIAVVEDQGTVNLLGGTVTWAAGVTPSDYATLLAAAVNAHGTGYSADSQDNFVLITAPPNLGGLPNGWIATVTKTGVSLQVDANFDGGVTALAGQPQQYIFSLGGTFDPEAQYSVTIAGQVYTSQGYLPKQATILLTHRNKIYAAAGSVVYFCSIDKPRQWLSGTGYGFINIANQSEGSQDLTGMGLWQGHMAFFTRTNVQVWDVFADELKNTLIQTISETGTMAPRSIKEVGGVDTYYLHDSGIRSLRTHLATGAAYSTDVGSPIDTIIRDQLLDVGDTVAVHAVAAIDPVDGRYMLAIDDTLYVYSSFPAAKIAAWSTYKPGFVIEDMVATAGRMFARSGDVIYCYGSLTGKTYPAPDEAPIIAWLPFSTMGKPGTEKGEMAADFALSGTWQVWALTNPNDTNDRVYVGEFSDVSFPDLRQSFPNRSTHLGLYMTCSSGGPASLSQAVIHHEMQETD